MVIFCEIEVFIDLLGSWGFGSFCSSTNLRVCALSCFLLSFSFGPFFFAFAVIKWNWPDSRFLLKSAFYKKGSARVLADLTLLIYFSKVRTYVLFLYASFLFSIL